MDVRAAEAASTDLTEAERDRLEPLKYLLLAETPRADWVALVNAGLYRAATDATWSECGERYDLSKNTCWRAMTYWQRAGLWTRVLMALRTRN